MYRLLPCLVLLLAFPTRAVAQEPAPPCDPGTLPAALIKAPKLVAWERTGWASLGAVKGATSGSEWDDDTAQMAAGPANPARPFSGAFDWAPSDEDGDWPVRPRGGDGHARLVARYRERANSSAPWCLRTVTRDVTVGRGNLPGIGLRRFKNLWLEGWVGGPDDCDDVRAGPVRLRVTGPRLRREWILRDVCGKWRSRRSYMTGVLHVDSFENEADTEWPSFRFDPQFRSANARRTYRVTAMQDGRVVSRRTFSIRWTFRPGRHIDEAEDDFVNVCINRNRTIRSRNGRLYCRTADDRNYSIRIRR